MWRLSIGVIAGALLVFFYIRLIERRSLYLPFREITQTPDYAGLEFEDIFIPTSDGEKINAWFIPSGAGAGVVFFLHGNGGNLSHRLEKIVVLHRMGLGVFILDYRGYGKSTGVPTEQGLYRDARAGWQYLRREIKTPAEKIVIFGESLGAAVAIDLAGEVKARALILEGAFTSVTDISRRVYPFLPAFLLSSRFDSLSKISALKLPKLFIHSRNDEVIPFDMGRKLFDAAGEPKVFLTLQGGHNEAFFLNEGDLIGKIKEFIDRF